MRELTAAVFGMAVLLMSVATEFSRGIGALACCIVPFAWLVTWMLIGSQSTPMRLQLVLGVPPALTVLVWLHLMSGIPRFVHREADPLIAEIRQYHDMHGTYPPGGGRRDAGETPAAMLPYLDQEAWCFYISEEDDCRVDCHSIGFSHAVYRFSTNTWWVGD